MKDLIAQLKQNEKPFGLMSEEMQAKAKEIGPNEFEFYNNDRKWKPFPQDDFYYASVARLRADYTEQDRDRVFSSTTDKELDDMNNTVGVTAHCSCGHVFTDDVVHGKSQAERKHTEPVEDEYELIEKWECRICSVPCRIEITYSDTKLPEHLKGNERFRDKRCFCKESHLPGWKRVDN